MQRAEWKGHCCREGPWAPRQAEAPAAEKHQRDLHCPEQIQAQAAVAMAALPEAATRTRD